MDLRMDFVPGMLCQLLIVFFCNILATAKAESKYDCDGQLTSSLPQSHFSSSSELSSSHSAGFARLNRRDGAGGWSPLSSNKYQWLQIDLGERSEITGIATQGKYGSSDWVTSYILMFSDTGRNWKQYHQEESISEFIGNTNADSVVHYKLQNHIIARFLRIAPVNWNSYGRIGMRVEMYGCAYRSDMVYLDGKSSILYRFQQKLMSTVKDAISLKFKTMQSDGVLLHGDGQNGDHITLQLVKGQLSLIINLGNAQFHPSPPHVNVSLGSLLDDQQWHSVIIERFSRQVNFSVDRHVHHFFMKGDTYHLDIDYELSFGGIPLKGKSVSLLQKNFHGCFENLYYNGVNIIDLAKRYKPQIYIVGNISYSCMEPETVPVTFLNSNSFLALPGLEQNGLTVSFQFRTWNKDGTLFSYKLGTESLDLVLYITDGKFKMSLFKHGRSQYNTATGFDLNNGHWHSLSFVAKRNRLIVTIDNQETLSLQTVLPFQLRSEDNYYFGGCPDNSTDHGCFSPVRSFLGCMKLISVGSNLIDIISLQQGQIGNFTDLQFDICGIIDRCMPNYCEHRGQCSQTWNDFYCNCSDTGYKGATCHYSVYEKSCEAYKHKGNTSGFFFIDSDGSGPLEPFTVYCNMLDTAVTVISHNNTDMNKVKNSNKENPHVMNFKYFADLAQLQETIDNAEHCKQELTYHCKKSRILHKQSHIPYSWWVGRTNETQTYWSGSSPDVNKCTCGIEENCIDSQLYCNCDADKSEWSNDTGFLSYKDHLPVTKIVITDTDRPQSEAAYKLGPLLCWGDRSFWNSASFNTVTSYLHFPTLHGEISADVSFFFKTSSPSGLFLENLGIKDFIRIELKSPTEVVFSFDVGNGPFGVTVQSPYNLNDNQWHFIKAERNIKEASLQVDQLPQKTIITPSDGHIRLQLNSQLYIGGTASRQKGFLGCIRYLTLNGIALDLEERAKVTPGIKPGCPGHCSSYGNLCHNGGKCVEKQNGFSCDCNFSAYGGPFCKKEISAYFGAGSSATLLFPENYTISRNSSWHSSTQQTDTNSKENIAFSFRTTQSPSLLLFVSSFNKQYISIIIAKNGSLQIRYKLEHHLDPDVFNINAKSLVDGHLQKVRLLRKGEALYIEVNKYTAVKFSLTSSTAFKAVQFLTLGKILAENVDVDLETMKANANGFIGCLSSMHFSHIFPLRTVFYHDKSPQVITTGHISESSCGSVNGIESTSSESTHTFADHSGPKDEREPIANAIRSDSAVIGGVISVVTFILLCITAIAIRIHLQKNTYKKNEAKASENEDNADTTAALKTEISMQNTINESQKEYFF
ncbi:contactin-associated protein-like 4 isoform X1 [Xenopus laevis]|uniref:Contactin-associated protein-like 4 isoform X1 n=1 Tax=Xenopus laevis TaxID=8355 RepID=A0A8J1KV00_XENLA|nr:contactin-associated protein-like 4 isoform X1 [Xenopus laevis]